VLSARRLKDIVERLVAIPHVSILRFHTRVPVVEPARITRELAKVLRLHPASHVVIHVNHPAELSAPVATALGLMVDAGIPLLSQSVLLKGVNDDAEILGQLFRKLAGLRVKPYYLHHFGQGARHQPFPCAACKGTSLDGRSAWPHFRLCAAQLCARYSGWVGQSASECRLCARSGAR
jgi:lysine 2,3-aminomutase